MQSHSRPKVEIESLQSQQRPGADVYEPDSSNRAMAHSRGLDPRSHLVLEHGSQQQRGQAYDQRRGDRSEPPPSPADSKRKHRRKDAKRAETSQHNLALAGYTMDNFTTLLTDCSH
jgi:hypothetical protein